MIDVIEMINKIFEPLISRKVTSAELGYGSFITIGFGKNVEFEITRRGKKEILSMPEWYLWTYMCSWEIEVDGEPLICSDDERSEIEESIKCLESRKLIGVEVLSDFYDMRLTFEGGIVLLLSSDNSDTDDIQWRLYTPDEKVLVAGPMKSISYQNSSSV